MKMNVVPNKSRLMISHEGLLPCVSGVNHDMPSRIQVEACKQWLMKFAKKKHLPHGKRLNSYYLKHVVEDAIEQYVSNGAFIQAAVELGFKYATSDGPNAFFHIDLRLPEDEWKRVKPTGFTKWLFKQEYLLLTVDAKEDPTWPRKAKRFIDFWWYLDRHCTVSEEDKDDLSDVWERWAGHPAPRPDFVDTDAVYDQECDFISYGDSYPLAAHGCTYLYALVDNEVVVIKPETSVERLRVRYIGQTTSPSKRLRDHIHRPGSIERVKWIGGLLNNSRSLRMAFDTVDKSRANVLEKAAIYSFCECETRWDDELGDFPPLDAALLNIDK